MIPTTNYKGRKSLFDTQCTTLIIDGMRMRKRSSEIKHQCHQQHFTQRVVNHESDRRRKILLHGRANLVKTVETFFNTR